MKRLLLVVLLLAGNTLLAAPPAEKWWDAYNRGVKAVNAKNYAAAAEALQKAIAEMPAESTAARTKNEIITYVPHFWLGIAKFNLGDPDGALREWKTSEDQGAIAKTEYYSRLKDWAAQAQVQKQRNAQAEASGAKKAADTALSRALSGQVAALSAGGDRTETYRNAQRRLQEALSQFHAAGTDIAAYGRAEETAKQAADLFAGAAAEGQKLRAAQKAAPPKPTQAQPAPVQTAAVVPPQTPQQVPVKIEPQAPVVTATMAPTPIESQLSVDARIAAQEYHRAVVDAVDASRAGTPQSKLARDEMRDAEKLRRQLSSAKTDADYSAIARTAAQRRAIFATKLAELRASSNEAAIEVQESRATAKQQLEAAYRAYATGDLTTSESTLSQLLASAPTKEAYLLRGCTRYTRALLARDGQSLIGAATSDFRSALAIDRSLRLDKSAFSPKLVAFFEQVKKQN